MVNRLLSVDEDNNLPPAVQEHLVGGVEDYFETLTTTAVGASITAVDAANTSGVNAASSEAASIIAQQAALEAQAPTDSMVSSLVLNTSSSTRIALDDVYPSRSEMDQVLDASNFPGVDNTGTTECSAALRSFFDACEAAGVRAFARGTFNIDSTVIIASSADLGDATFNYTGTSIAVQIGRGTSPLQRRIITAPRIIYTPKTALGWAPGRIGLRISSAYGCVITVPHIKDFEIGLQTYGENVQGVSYCSITIGGLDNNKINLNLSGDDTGWSNQNVFIAGRFSHNSNEGAIVPGTRHILFSDIPASRPNGNTFVGCSVESPNVVEYAVDIDAGTYNEFLNVRFENTGPDPRVRFGAKAQQNMFQNGFGLSHTSFTKVAGSTNNNLFTTDRIEFAGPNVATMRLENRASNSALSFGVYTAGTLAGNYDPAADYSVGVSATGITVKNKADAPANARVRIESGGVYFGQGLAPAAAFITANQNTLQLSGLPVRIPSYTTANRPIASVVGAAAMIYDTTLGKPVWSNGSVWRDASGTNA